MVYGLTRFADVTLDRFFNPAVRFLQILERFDYVFLKRVGGATMGLSIGVHLFADGWPSTLYGTHTFLRCFDQLCGQFRHGFRVIQLEFHPGGKTKNFAWVRMFKNSPKQQKHRPVRCTRLTGPSRVHALIFLGGRREESKLIACYKFVMFSRK